jgi:hypothetical protein
MNPKQNEHSHLFLVRLWSEGVGDHNGWQGRVQDVRSGEARIFQDWPMLINLLLEMAETESIKGIESGAPDGKKEEAF